MALSTGMSIEQIGDLDLTYVLPFAPVGTLFWQAANKARFQLASEGDRLASDRVRGVRVARPNEPRAPMATKGA